MSQLRYMRIPSSRYRGSFLDVYRHSMLQQLITHSNQNGSSAGWTYIDFNAGSDVYDIRQSTRRQWGVNTVFDYGRAMSVLQHKDPRLVHQHPFVGLMRRVREVNQEPLRDEPHTGPQTSTQQHDDPAQGLTKLHPGFPYYPGTLNIVRPLMRAQDRAILVDGDICTVKRLQCVSNNDRRFKIIHADVFGKNMIGLTDGCNSKEDEALKADEERQIQIRLLKFLSGNASTNNDLLALREALQTFDHKWSKDEAQKQYNKYSAEQDLNALRDSSSATEPDADDFSSRTTALPGVSSLPPALQGQYSKLFNLLDQYKKWLTLDNKGEMAQEMVKKMNEVLGLRITEELIMKHQNMIRLQIETSIQQTLKHANNDTDAAAAAPTTSNIAIFNAPPFDSYSPQINFSSFYTIQSGDSYEVKDRKVKRLIETYLQGQYKPQYYDYTIEDREKVVKAQIQHNLTKLYKEMSAFLLNENTDRFHPKKPYSLMTEDEKNDFIEQHIVENEEKNAIEVLRAVPWAKLPNPRALIKKTLKYQLLLNKISNQLELVSPNCAIDIPPVNLLDLPTISELKSHRLHLRRDVYRRLKEGTMNVWDAAFKVKGFDELIANYPRWLLINEEDEEVITRLNDPKKLRNKHLKELEELQGVKAESVSRAGRSTLLDIDASDRSSVKQILKLLKQASNDTTALLDDVKLYQKFYPLYQQQQRQSGTQITFNKWYSENKALVNQQYEQLLLATRIANVNAKINIRNKLVSGEFSQLFATITGVAATAPSDSNSKPLIEADSPIAKVTKVENAIDKELRTIVQTQFHYDVLQDNDTRYQTLYGSLDPVKVLGVVFDRLSAPAADRAQLIAKAKEERNHQIQVYRNKREKVNKINLEFQESDIYELEQKRDAYENAILDMAGVPLSAAQALSADAGQVAAEKPEDVKENNEEEYGLEDEAALEERLFNRALHNAKQKKFEALTLDENGVPRPTALDADVVDDLPDDLIDFQSASQAAIDINRADNNNKLASSEDKADIEKVDEDVDDESLTLRDQHYDQLIEQMIDEVDESLEDIDNPENQPQDTEELKSIYNFQVEELYENLMADLEEFELEKLPLADKLTCLNSRVSRRINNQLFTRYDLVDPIEKDDYTLTYDEFSRFKSFQRQGMVYKPMLLYQPRHSTVVQDPSTFTGAKAQFIDAAMLKLGMKPVSKKSSSPAPSSSPKILSKVRDVVKDQVEQTGGNTNSNQIVNQLESELKKLNTDDKSAATVREPTIDLQGFTESDADAKDWEVFTLFLKRRQQLQQEWKDWFAAHEKEILGNDPAYVDKYMQMLEFVKTLSVPRVQILYEIHRSRPRTIAELTPQQIRERQHREKRWRDIKAKMELDKITNEHSRPLTLHERLSKLNDDDLADTIQDIQFEVHRDSFLPPSYNQHNTQQYESLYEFNQSFAHETPSPILTSAFDYLKTQEKFTGAPFNTLNNSTLAKWDILEEALFIQQARLKGEDMIDTSVREHDNRMFTNEGYKLLRAKFDELNFVYESAVEAAAEAERTIPFNDENIDPYQFYDSYVDKMDFTDGAITSPKLEKQNLDNLKQINRNNELKVLEQQKRLRHHIRMLRDEVASLKTDEERAQDIMSQQDHPDDPIDLRLYRRLFVLFNETIPAPYLPPLKTALEKALRDYDAGTQHDPERIIQQLIKGVHNEGIRSRFEHFVHEHYTKHRVQSIDELSPEFTSAVEKIPLKTKADQAVAAIGLPLTANAFINFDLCNMEECYGDGDIVEAERAADRLINILKQQVFARFPNATYLITYPIFGRAFNDRIIHQCAKFGHKRMINTSFHLQMGGDRDLADRLYDWEPWGIGSIIIHPPPHFEQVAKDLVDTMHEVVEGFGPSVHTQMEKNAITHMEFPPPEVQYSAKEFVETTLDPNDGGWHPRPEVAWMRHRPYSHLDKQPTYVLKWEFYTPSFETPRSDRFFRLHRRRIKLESDYWKFSRGWRGADAEIKRLKLMSQQLGRNEETAKMPFNYPKSQPLDPNNLFASARDYENLFPQSTGAPLDANSDIAQSFESFKSSKSSQASDPSPISQSSEFLQSSQPDSASASSSSTSSPQAPLTTSSSSSSSSQPLSLVSGLPPRTHPTLAHARRATPSAMVRSPFTQDIRAQMRSVRRITDPVLQKERYTKRLQIYDLLTQYGSVQYDLVAPAKIAEEQDKANARRRRLNALVAEKTKKAEAAQLEAARTRQAKRSTRVQLDRIYSTKQLLQMVQPASKKTQSKPDKPAQ